MFVLVNNELMNEAVRLDEMEMRRVCCGLIKTLGVGILNYPCRGVQFM